MHTTDETNDASEALGDARTVRAIRRRLGRAEKAALGALAVVVTLFVSGKIAESARTSRGRASLLAKQTEIASTIPARDVELPARIAAFTSDLATGPWTGSSLSPRLSSASAASALFAETGVYLRVASTMAGDPAAIHEAAKTSMKDAVSTCLLVELRSPDQDPMETAAGCEPGTACLGERTGNLHNLRELHRGLDVLSAQFRHDAAESDGLALYALGEQLESRRADVRASAEIASNTAYALIVVDEVPAGFPMPWFASSLEAVQTTPHQARVAVIDTRTGESLLRVRLDADRAVSAAAWPSAAVGRQVQSCGLGLDVAAFIEGARSAARLTAR